MVYALLRKGRTMKAKAIGAMVAVLLVSSGVVLGQTHAHWPADWNNWNDPALWVPVGNPGNAADTHGAGYGSVGYEYNIGKFEVTAGQYTAFLNAVGGVDTYALYNTKMSGIDSGSGITRNGSGTVGAPYTYSVAPNSANRPVNYVSWGDAVRFANWLTNGKGNGSTETGAYDPNGAITDSALIGVAVPSAARRATWSNGEKPYFLLPSEDEWYKAAYYNPANGAYFDYPTSSNTVPGRDMTETTMPGNNANYQAGSGTYTTIVGEFQLSDSPYGTFDQGGNVFEWNEAVYSVSNRIWRGGAFGFGAPDLLASARYVIDRSLAEDTSAGFRVSVVPEPATLSLLALGGLAMMRRQRRMA
jgi:formylglycine-generating enzyme required for sulfatase activity